MGARVPQFLQTQNRDAFRRLFRGNVATEIGHGIPSRKHPNSRKIMPRNSIRSWERQILYSISSCGVADFCPRSDAVYTRFSLLKGGVFMGRWSSTCPARCRAA